MSAFQPAERLETIPEYIFSRLNKAVAKVERQSGRKVLNLGTGTPDVLPAQQYSDKFAQLVKDSSAHAYPGYGATKDFAEALQAWYRQRFGVTLASDELLPLNGAKDGIAHLPLALFNAGDEILVPDPGYPSFCGPALLVGAKPVPYTLSADKDFKIDLPELQKKLSPRSSYLWVNFPSNPTGQVASLPELEEIVAFARAHDLIILYDNAYAEITFSGTKAPSILEVPGAKELAVEIGSFSKAFSFAGFRMGWIVGNKSVIASLAKLKSQMDSGLSLPLQGLGAYALTHPDKSWHEAMIATYKSRRDTVAGYLQGLGLTFSLPEGSLYLWAKIPDGFQSSEAYCQHILQEKQVLFTPGSAYGDSGEGYVRVSISVDIDGIGDYL